MLLIEQLLTAGLAIGLGFSIGKVVSYILTIFTISGQRLGNGSTIPCYFPSKRYESIDASRACDDVNWCWVLTPSYQKA